VASDDDWPVATLIDSNVLIDIISHDPTWEAWSQDALAEASETGILVINPVVYGEVSVDFDTREALDAVLPEDDFVRADIPWPAAFLAGKCFETYRRRGGTKRSPLPDFFIGAHAAVSKLRLLTRDASRYRSYFPTVELIAP
jgi:predicted nucleic acid-binding protein